MNIFALDLNPKIAAEMVCDIHTNSQTKESGQILHSGAWRVGVTYPEEDWSLYQPNNPCMLWVTESVDNWIWLRTHGLELARQKEIRYGGEHPARRKIEKIGFDERILGKLPKIGLTPFRQNMPEQYRIPGDPVTAYRNFYCNEKIWQKRKDHRKIRLARWEKGIAMPEWFLEAA